MAIKTQIWQIEQIPTTNKTHFFTLQTQRDKTLYIEQIWLITKQNEHERHWRFVQHLTYHDHKNTNWQWFIHNKHVKDDRLQHNQRDIYTQQFRQSSSVVQFRVVDCNRGSRWPCFPLMQHFLFFFLNLFSPTSIRPARFSKEKWKRLYQNKVSPSLAFTRKTVSR